MKLSDCMYSLMAGRACIYHKVHTYDGHVLHRYYITEVHIIIHASKTHLETVKECLERALSVITAMFIYRAYTLRLGKSFKIVGSNVRC